MDDRFRGYLSTLLGAELYSDWEKDPTNAEDFQVILPVCLGALVDECRLHSPWRHVPMQKHGRLDPVQCNSAS